MKRVLTGIQPSGELHLGNYFGAIDPCLRAQEDSNTDLLVFVADYHALTTIHEGPRLHAYTTSLVEKLLAFGFDPGRMTLFKQSDVPEVTELALLLSMVTGMGLLQRAHSYKDKIARGLTPNVGLFFYPVLMAADILIYGSEIVPVGHDQLQHVEMARDMAIRFNESFGPVFKLPEAMVSETPKVPGTDGQKMSKSYNNTISPFAEGKELRTAIASIKTSSTPFGAPLPTEGCSVYALLSLLSDEEEKKELQGIFRTGRQGGRSFGYGAAKQLLAQKIEDKFAPARDRLEQLRNNPDEIEEALQQGATRARKLAQDCLSQCRIACGLD